MPTLSRLALLLLALPCLLRAEKDVLEPFPQAEEGMIRYVLRVPPVEDEFERRIQLQVGKVMEVDSVNTHIIGGLLQEKELQGWGYTYWVMDNPGPMAAPAPGNGKDFPVASTMMAVDPEAPRVQKFIQVGGVPDSFRYNSRLPLVVYVPKGFEVRYRIWAPLEAEASVVPVE